MADRMRFDDSQLADYYARIALPKDKHSLSTGNLSNEEQLRYLELLKKHHLVNIPFENLTLHYSWHRVVDVKPRHLFSKIVKQNGRGGYCMEVNSLFHTLLLTLGFNVYMAGARVYDPGRKFYGGFSHCVNIVQIGGIQYMVDVGFGANGPSSVIPLQPGHEQAHIEPARMRLVHEPIAQNVNQDCKVWIYQHKIDDQAGWVPMYCFVDFEFLLEDIRGMNLSPSKSPSSFFRHKILTTRFTTTREVHVDKDLRPKEALEFGGEIDGALIIDHDKLKWRRNGKTVLERTLESEEERLTALKKYFGIQLAVEDREAIRGTVGAISTKSMDSTNNGSKPRMAKGGCFSQTSPVDSLTGPITMSPSPQVALKAYAAPTRATTGTSENQDLGTPSNDTHVSSKPIVFLPSPVYPLVSCLPADRISNGKNQYSLFNSPDQEVIYQALRLRCHAESLLQQKRFLTAGNRSSWSDGRLPRGIDAADFLVTAQSSSKTIRRVVAIDCEMVGVRPSNPQEDKARSELAQLCAIDVLTGEVLIDKLVLPKETVVDWRTRYSGVSYPATRIAKAQGRLLHGWRAARTELLNYVDAETIIVGHSVLHDLQMLRLAHSKIVDTAFQTAESVFGDMKMCTRLWGLKELAKVLTNLSIQIGKKGHDCIEDTLATREIALWCICYPENLAAWAAAKREDLKKQKIEREKRLKEEAKKRREAELAQSGTMAGDQGLSQAPLPPLGSHVSTNTLFDFGQS
ncbi:arylamine n-acetyltransferase 1 [Seiridium cupressi]